MFSFLLQTPQAVAEEEQEDEGREPVAGTSSGRKTDEEEEKDEPVAGTSSGRKKYTKYTVSYEEFWDDFWEDYEDFWM